MSDFHQPVLLKEALAYLNVRRGKKYIDATVGGGGHTAALLSKGGLVLGIDTDPEAVEFVRKRFAAELKAKSSKLKVIRGNFKDIEKIAKENGFYPVAGILYDLGLSSYQLEKSGRGFSFQKDEPLDMRADPDLKVTAADLVNGLSEDELTKLFQKYGEEKRARTIARAIVRQRSTGPITTSKQLADLVVNTVGGEKRARIHPATKVFQALRIAVNDELNNLQSSLPQAFELLEPGGRLVVISFHSLEDRIVKRTFEKLGGKIMTKKPVTPSAEEVRKNPRARSAKLRAIALTVVFVVVIALAFAQFVVANEISTQGEEIIRLESEKEKLQKEIAILRQETAQLGSLSRVREEAQKLGFIYSSTAFEFVLPPKLAQAQ